MQVTHFWDKLYLHRHKIVFALALCVCAFAAEAQKSTRWVQKNNPNYDNKKLTYGFLIALHSSIYQTQYSDRFVSHAFDTVHSVTSSWTSGFSLGFIVNYRLTEFLDIRLTPDVAFYEQQVMYQYTDEHTDNQRLESTMVEFPLLLKYKSERRGNIRMYMIGGVKPAIEASGKKDAASSRLEISKSNMSLEAGFGFDLYYPLFKFSPEIRFSRGIVNMLGNPDNEYGQPLRRMNTNTITLYFLFQ
ncbi:outer membrane beta-barrel protein [Chryseolinea lacunae]|uniref:PorT family protein n=1 Tax=Chryseolinea lacunae TaxID=2801331 RepID=A0ABS1KNQ1_9BACT|nr:outer membrane beta-barrel protein [Chryseolinea lacunae]MBL0740863.1 PorT family protein [Chryseolinea lacunae]